MVFGKSVLSVVIYFLAVIDSILVTVFYSRLMNLSTEELEDGNQIDINIWVDYSIWIVFIILAVFYHYKSDKLEADYAEIFHLENKKHIKLVKNLFSNLLPLLILVVLFFRAINWLH